jgi:RNA polymerase sigma factor (TIGR02999 family)
MLDRPHRIAPNPDSGDQSFETNALPNPRGERPAMDRARGQAGMIDEVYEHLRRVARRYLRSERVGHTLEATDLVHEAFLRLNRIPLADRAHAAAAGAQAMRRVLISHARRKLAAIHGGGAVHVPIVRESDGSDRADRSPDGLAAFAETRAAMLLDLDGALEELLNMSPRLHEVVELRFFGGLSVEEVASSTGRSTASVKRDWSRARAWLYTRMHDPLEEGGTA